MFCHTTCWQEKLWRRRVELASCSQSCTKSPARERATSLPLVDLRETPTVLATTHWRPRGWAKLSRKRKIFLQLLQEINKAPPGWRRLQRLTRQAHWQSEHL